MMSLLFCLVLQTETSTSAVEEVIRQARLGRAGLPALRDVQRAAAESVSDAWELQDGEWARPRWQGLVPDVLVRVGTTQDVSVRDTTLEREWTREGRDLGVDVTLKWRLRDLVFSRAEPGLLRDRLARRRLQDARRDDATKIWFQRLEVEIKLRSKPTSSLLLEAARLDGLLESVTGRRWRTQS